MQWYIGNVKITNQIVLAPMAGITNTTYRKIIKSMGVGLVYTEMVSDKALVNGNKKTLELLKMSKESPITGQIFGSDATTMASAAKIMESIMKPDIIDINLGCPAPKIALKNNSGSALLKSPQKIKAIVKGVVKAVSIPVTVKIRSGWDEASINAVEVAKICESSGAKAIAVHARTRSQGYSGKADWNIIKEVKEAVSIPVIGNGDVTSCYKAKEMLEYTGCDAVMIARGSLGNPWLIKECVDYLDRGILPKEVSINEKINMMKKHYQMLVKDTNQRQALLEMRTHFLWYLKGIPNGKEIKVKICQSKTKEEVMNIIKEYESIL